MKWLREAMTATRAKSKKQMTKQKDIAGGKRRTKLGDNDTEKGYHSGGRLS